jgi:hypothetical protein
MILIGSITECARDRVHHLRHLAENLSEKLLQNF